MIDEVLTPLRRCGRAPLRAWRCRRCGGTVDWLLLSGSLLMVLWGLINAVRLFFV